MTTSRRLLVIFAALGGTAAALALGTAGCSGSTSGTSPVVDSGNDGTTGDGGEDAPGSNESGVDGTVDTGSDVSIDTSNVDTSTADVGAESGADASDAPAESASDASPIDGGEADADAGLTMDAGGADADAAGMDAEAGPDSAAMLAFPLQVATALCTRFMTCCNGTTSTFDLPACTQQFASFGYAGSNTGAYDPVSGQSILGQGTVVFDSTQAQSCLNQINALDCAANLRTTGQEKSIISACFGALSGTLGVGAPCRFSIECMPGEFCLPPAGGNSEAADGGALGTCTALRTAGQGCNDFGSGQTAVVASTQECSYRGSGNTALTCLAEDFVSGTRLDAGTWKCVSQLGQDASSCYPSNPTGPTNPPSCCNFNTDCQTMLCDTFYFTCATSEAITSTNTCQTFALDAGGD